MSHQRYPSHDAVKEPHAVSLKVLRLSRPSLVAQYPLQPPFSAAPDALSHPPPLAASLAYSPNGVDNNIAGAASSGSSSGRTSVPTNPTPFVLSPILNLPPSFGSAYVGETFSCTLCANYDIPPEVATNAPAAGPRGGKKTIRDVRIEAEMKTPSSTQTSGAATKLVLGPSPPSPSPSQSTSTSPSTSTDPDPATDLTPGTTLQKILSFDLKEEGSHVLAVTVSYYEATELSGRTRTFRKLYQFVCKPSLIVRTKPGVLRAASAASAAAGTGTGTEAGGRVVVRRRWVLEAQLENCSEEGIMLEKVGLDLDEGLGYQDCNWDWEEEGEEGEEEGAQGGEGRSGSGGRPVLQPGETEQVCFVIEEEEAGGVKEVEGRVVFGILQIGWRSEMGNRGFLSTGRLGTRLVKPR
ncbi:hypothetical protein B0J18DRAFT_432051 [Chaetomium sp. MPI-SDFR-AT-0129]|nr:hypothetical protein B0J18DRAFT_432051 [Chaetomium sp. MPI-SDFR-AT-0129]